MWQLEQAALPAQLRQLLDRRMTSWIKASSPA